MNGWDTKAVMASYEHGKALGWFEDGPNGTRHVHPAGRAQL